MSSAISTDPADVKPAPSRAADDSLQPWQFFVLAALACAVALTFILRGQGYIAIVLVTLLMGAIAFVGVTALGTFLPLVSTEDDRTVMIGGRTRAAFEREKLLTLRTIKELEFDRAMGKLSEEDFQEMSGRLRVRAGRLIRQLDAGSGYRTQVEKDLAKRLGAHLPQGSGGQGQPIEAPTTRACAACSTENDADAKFCKSCGQKLS